MSCAFQDVAIEILPSVNVNRLCGLFQDFPFPSDGITHLASSIFGIFFCSTLGLFVVFSRLHYSQSLYDCVLYHFPELWSGLTRTGKIHCCFLETVRAARSKMSA